MFRTMFEPLLFRPFLLRRRYRFHHGDTEGSYKQDLHNWVRPLAI
jgi:hypothetical protein